MLVVQVIEVRYRKASRGGEGAQVRAALPTALGVPTSEGDLLHQVSMDEWDGFVVRAGAGPLVLGSQGLLVGGRVRISREDGSVVLADTYGVVRMAVERGWGRLRCNERVETYDTWWYRELIVNAAVVVDTGTGQIFVGEAGVSRDLRVNVSRRRLRAGR